MYPFGFYACYGPTVGPQALTDSHRQYGLASALGLKAGAAGVQQIARNNPSYCKANHFPAVE